ncbi:uncharacterized protein L969DRAFT_87674 [Mixia osmundae IAM 14324]|uniref:uncharacterized protein n=1 Tax=Mixia osmundae (strain CBS 9802 / IAM 14324 / JCM 22182 / KY 12970) TaxID=764103 RepID=UPI0004A55A3B|nr:uncharacterized protein L969DRAFT_87674 [Mixia osmundae IAM 14324]KEI39681.1 hypothetical protein L969DRAFT_87674 [Mixia osmundae IAM 14324]
MLTRPAWAATLAVATLASIILSRINMAAKPAPQNGRPPAGLLGEDLDDYVPAGLRLLQAHLFVRHGERTPVRRRMQNVGMPDDWILCHLAGQFDAAVANSQGTLTSFPMVVKAQRQDQVNSPRVAPEGACHSGQPTDLGRSSLLSVGEQLRATYIDRLGFLPSMMTAKDEGVVTFRTTPIQRTIESLQQTIQGLYPRQQMDGWKPTIMIRDIHEESLWPNPSACKRLYRLDKEAQQLAKVEHEEALAGLDDKIARFFPNPIRVDSHPRANGILDTINAARSHGMHVPEPFLDPVVLRTLERAVLAEFFNGYRSPEFKRLAMGRLTGDMLESFKRKAAQPTSEKLRLALHSCHDTTLGGLTRTFGVEEEAWPPFSSHVGFELFETPSTQGSLSFFSTFFRSQSRSDHFVRMRYNGKTMKIPACQAQGQHLQGSSGEVCTLAGFEKALEGISITKADWERECNA